MHIFKCIESKFLEYGLIWLQLNLRHLQIEKDPYHCLQTFVIKILATSTRGMRELWHCAHYTLGHSADVPNIPCENNQWQFVVWRLDYIKVIELNFLIWLFINSGRQLLCRNRGFQYTRTLHVPRLKIQCHVSDDLSHTSTRHVATPWAWLVRFEYLI